MTATRCGFVALIGAPNAGKSTLINTLVGTKVAIVTPKKQTTRSRVLGIRIEGGSQLIFIDTPGIFQPQRRLDRAMVAAAWSGAEDADRTVLLVDASTGKVGAETRAIVERLRQQQRPAMLALNKVDLIRRDRLLGLAAALNGLMPFAETFMISALTGDGVDRMVAALAEAVPEGPWLYPEDEITDMPLRLAAAEITREQLYLKLHQELPYAAAVETEEWKEQPDGSVAVRQAITVERESQKAIVIGHRGQMVKAIGTAARLELERILEQHVHLTLFVKVREGWADDPEQYRPWGLEYDS